MAVPNNEDNITWINDHCKGNGADALNQDVGFRVPKNDNGIGLKPSSLFMDSIVATFNKANWKYGSINRAVIETYKAGGGVFAGDDTIETTDAYKAKHGVFSLIELGVFININMLWGLAGDARNKNPGDAMSYRAYPTPVLIDAVYEVRHGKTNTKWAPDGSLTGPSTGSWLIMRHVVSLVHPLPYDLVYSIRLPSTENGSAAAAEITAFVKIKAGSLAPTDYSTGVYPGAITWIGLKNGEYIHSIDSSDTSTWGVTATFRHGIDIMEQLPVYNDVSTTTTDITVDEDVFDPPSPPLALAYGNTYHSTVKLGPFDILTDLTACSEISDRELFKTNDEGETQPPLTTVYLPYVDPLAATPVTITWQDGMILNANSYNNFTLGDGYYIWATELPGVILNGSQIYSVERWVLMENGIATYARDVASAGTQGCFIEP